MISDNCCLNFFPFCSGEHLEFVPRVSGTDRLCVLPPWSPLAPGGTELTQACAHGHHERCVLCLGRFGSGLCFGRGVSALWCQGSRWWMCFLGWSRSSMGSWEHPCTGVVSGNWLSWGVWGCGLWGGLLSLGKGHLRQVQQRQSCALEQEMWSCPRPCLPS